MTTFDAYAAFAALRVTGLEEFTNLRTATA
jgi:hypothetical protein